MDFDKFLTEHSYLTQRQSRDGINTYNCPKSHLKKVAQDLRDNFEFQSLNDIAAIDMGECSAPQRFGAVYHFFSHTKKKYVGLVVMCDSVEAPTLPSLTSVYKGADWLEREAFDMMGIVFEDHPNLHRILMWETYTWHPLRKDFPLCGKEAPLPETFQFNEDATKVIPAPENGGPFHSPSCSTKFVADREPRSIDGQCGGIENI